MMTIPADVLMSSASAGEPFSPLAEDDRIDTMSHLTLTEAAPQGSFPFDLLWDQLLAVDGAWIAKIDAAADMPPGAEREKILLDAAAHFLAEARKAEPSGTDRIVFSLVAKEALQHLVDGNREPAVKEGTTCPMK